MIRTSLWLALSLLGACAASTQQSEGTAPETGATYTALPPGEHPEGETAAEEETAAEPETEGESEAAAEPEAGTEPGAAEPVCTLAPDAPEAARWIAVFGRWMRDQSVGRHVTVESIVPICGDLEGRTVLELVLSGSAGELQSLGNALESYYPGSSWNSRGHTRLEGEGYQMRIIVEVSIPAGAEPRPRCTWDPDLPCE